MFIYLILFHSSATSRVAFDETGRPVGAAVNNVCNKHEVGVELEEELKDVEDPRYKPIRAIHHTLRCLVMSLVCLIWDGYLIP